VIETEADRGVKQLPNSFKPAERTSRMSLSQQPTRRR
jgi:hypothetical protein